MKEPAVPHRFEVRVYYEDTDLAGIVYYANYLKFIERARTEWVRGLGVDQTALRAEAGIVFAVRRLEADYIASARFDDLLAVTTEAVAATCWQFPLASGNLSVIRAANANAASIRQSRHMNPEILGVAADVDYSLWGLYLRATLTVKLVMIVLVIASVWSWAIIIGKLI